MLFVAAGCGSESHVNNPRPQPPTRVSVTVTEDAITLQPRRIAIGPEPTQQIPQNQHAGQPSVRSKEPLNVAFVTANLTKFDSKLEVRGPRAQATSLPLVAHGAVTLLAGLPTGVYTLTAADIPGAAPVRLTVGPYRSSSENDVLLP
jgi:hypothetical protein